MEPAQFRNAFAEDDVHAAAGHICRNSDGVALAGLGDQGSFNIFVTGIQDVVRDIGDGPADGFGGFHAFGADEDGAARFVVFPDGLNNGAELGGLGGEECVCLIDADAWFVGGDDFDVEPVDPLKLFGLGGGGAGHAAEVFVLEDEVLEGKGAKDAARFLDFEPLLFLDRGVNAGGPAALISGAAFVLVDGDDTVFADEVIDVLFEKVLGVESVVEGSEEAVGCVVDLFDLQDVFSADEAFIGNFDVLIAGIEGVVDGGAERAGGGAGTAGASGDAIAFAGEDEGDASFVDEDGIGFVDDGGE